MSSISFDPIAHVYDATRGYPQSVAQQIAPTIDRAADATPNTAFLEVGVGTGRIAFPLASLGHIYTGVDISAKMIEQLETKLKTHGWQENILPWGGLPDEDTVATPVVHRFKCPEKPASMRLVMSDMSALPLPFHRASFDVVIAVHVFHLMQEWRQALKEVLRVLRSGGVLLHCWNEQRDGRQDVGDAWRKIMEDLGGNVKRVGAASEAEVSAWLKEQGLQPEQTCVLNWPQTSTPRQQVEYYEQRRGSHTWAVPDDIFAVSIERLWQWANEYYGAAIDKEYQQEHHFIISKTRV